MTIASPRLAEACKRWNPQFDPCIPFPDKCADAAAGDFEARKFIIGLNWTPTAAKACENWGKYGNDGKVTQIVDGNEDSPFVTCNFVTDPLPVPEYIYWYDKNEDCCYRTPNGPHANINNLDPISNQDIANDFAYEHVPFFNETGTPVRTGPTPGKPFTWYHEPVAYGPFRGLHHSQSVNVRRSLAVPGSPPDQYNDEYLAQSYSALRNHTTLGNLEKDSDGMPFCPDGVLDNNLPSTSPCKPQLDHIIPKKDIYGCDCGSSSYSNSILISRKLNQGMSNDCQNPDRIAIMNVYAPQAFAASGEAPEAYSSDEGDDVNGPADPAGCGVGGMGRGRGWGFVGLGGLFLATIARARRVRR
ncbi:MAG: hypothetical protein IPG04_20655 [Polyangiaceae bacterium]|nr:hypothetical protein [Polyangiaceae bacterium]